MSHTHAMRTWSAIDREYPFQLAIPEDDNFRQNFWDISAAAKLGCAYRMFGQLEKSGRFYALILFARPEIRDILKRQFGGEPLTPIDIERGGWRRVVAI